MASRQQVVNREEEGGIALLVADVYEAAGALRRWGETLAAAEGQTQARWQLLSVVSERPLTVPQAARRLGISRQAVQRSADDAVKQGLTSFQPNPEHRSSPLVELTPSGRQVLQNINERAQQFNRHADLLLAAPDIETTRRVLAHSRRPRPDSLGDQARRFASLLGSFLAVAVVGERNQTADGCLQVGKVVFDRRFDNGVRGVEVAVREAIPHTGNLRPGEFRAVGQQIRREALDGLADLDEPHTNGVEDQAVVKSSALEVSFDG